MLSFLSRIIAHRGLTRQDFHATSKRNLTTGYPITILAGLLRTEMLETLPFPLLNTAWAVAYIQTMEVCSFFFSPSWYVLLAVEAASRTHPVALCCRVRLQFTIVLPTVQRHFLRRGKRAKLREVSLFIFSTSSLLPSITYFQAPLTLRAYLGVFDR